VPARRVLPGVPPRRAQTHKNIPGLNIPDPSFGQDLFGIGAAELLGVKGSVASEALCCRRQIAAIRIYAVGESPANLGELFDIKRAYRVYYGGRCIRPR